MPGVHAPSRLCHMCPLMAHMRAKKKLTSSAQPLVSALKSASRNPASPLSLRFLIRQRNEKMTQLQSKDNLQWEGGEGEGGEDEGQGGGAGITAAATSSHVDL